MQPDDLKIERRHYESSVELRGTQAAVERVRLLLGAPKHLVFRRENRWRLLLPLSWLRILRRSGRRAERRLSAAPPARRGSV